MQLASSTTTSSPATARIRTGNAKHTSPPRFRRDLKIPLAKVNDVDVLVLQLDFIVLADRGLVLDSGGAGSCVNPCAATRTNREHLAHGARSPAASAR